MHGALRWATILLALLAAASRTAVAAGGSVINEHGISVKLITTRDSQLHEAPDSSSSSAPCDVFSYWYVLPPERSAPSRRLADLESLTRNGFYRVAAGDTEREYRGWIHEDDVVEWHHRQAVKFAKRTGRGLAYFFPSDEKAIAAARSGETAAATHREPETTGGNLILMPLLKTKGVAVDGLEMNVFEVAFMSGRPVGAGQESPSSPPISVAGLDGEVTRQTVRDASTADIVFILDTTRSMEPPIRQVLYSISRVVEALVANQDLRQRLRFGLVAYRDQGDEYLTELFCNLEQGQEHQFFLARLDSIAVGGGGDYPEDVLAGLARALRFDEMKWNPLAWKQIVIVSDSSIKGPDHPMSGFQQNEKGRTIAAMTTELQPGSGGAQELMTAGFVVTAVLIENPAVAVDHPIAESQFGALVKGRSYQGDLIAARGGVNPEDFSDKLTESILSRLTNYDQAILQGKGRDVATSSVKEADFPYPVLDLIDALPEDGSEAEGIRFASRFCTEFDPEGNRLFVPHLFIRKGQLKSFNSMLEFLQGALEDAGEPGHRDVGQILRSLQVIATSLNLSEPITAEMPLDRFLQVLLGIPLKTPVFQLTIGDLAAMSQTDYDDWVRGVKSSTETVNALIDNPNIWYKLHPTAREREEHAFVALADLP